MPGYISLHRDIQKHWLYEEERVFSRYEAWLDILMRVNHTEGKVTHNGALETVDRGSTIWSMGDMEKHWGWSNKKVKRFLDCLANDQMLSYKSTTKKTYLTVVNYDFYQESDKSKAPPKHHQSTTDAFQKHTNNNENNVNNENNEKPLKDIVPFSEIIDYLNLKIGKNFKATTANTKKHIHARWKEDYRLNDFMTVIDKKTAEWLGTDMEKYLCPDTLFGTKFEKYLNQKIVLNGGGNYVKPQGIGQGVRYSRNQAQGGGLQIPDDDYESLIEGKPKVRMQ